MQRYAQHQLMPTPTHANASIPNPLYPSVTQLFARPKLPTPTLDSHKTALFIFPHHRINACIPNLLLYSFQPKSPPTPTSLLTTNPYPTKTNQPPSTSHQTPYITTQQAFSNFLKTHQTNPSSSCPGCCPCPPCPPCPGCTGKGGGIATSPPVKST